MWNKWIEKDTGFQYIRETQVTSDEGVGWRVVRQSLWNERLVLTNLSLTPSQGKWGEAEAVRRYFSIDRKRLYLFIVCTKFMNIRDLDPQMSWRVNYNRLFNLFSTMAPTSSTVSHYLLSNYLFIKLLIWQETYPWQLY